MRAVANAGVDVRGESLLVGLAAGVKWPTSGHGCPSSNARYDSDLQLERLAGMQICTPIWPGLAPFL